MRSSRVSLRTFAVAAAARLLAGHVGHYTYISTISVYADAHEGVITEASPTIAGFRDVTGFARDVFISGALQMRASSLPSCRPHCALSSFASTRSSAPASTMPSSMLLLFLLS